MHAIQLPKASLSTLSGHKQQWIVCEQGMIWLSDDGHDVILQRGQRWQVLQDTPVVIEAIQHSRFAIQTEQFRPQTWLLTLQTQLNDCLHHLLHKPAIKTHTA